MFQQELQAEIHNLIENVKVIYKYIDFEGGLKLLSSVNLMIKNPSKFNDPYDCFSGLIDFEKMPDNYIKYLINKYDNNLNRAERRNKIRSTIKNSKKDLIELLKNNLIEKERNTRGITCFSKRNDNLLMWSQYASSHEGICIGFNLEKLYRSLKTRPFKELALMEVIYTNDLVPINFYNDGFRAVVNWLRTKSNSWKYEEEVRLMFGPIEFDVTNTLLVGFDKTAIEEIYLGTKILKENENVLIDLIASNFIDTDIFKMGLSPNYFKLLPKRQ